MAYSNSVLKRIFDLFVGSVAALVASPIILVSIIAIKLESSGSAFFLQERTGRGDTRFKVFKLRTMVNNASKIGPVLTQKNDSRVTKIGRFLRRSSFDELPQIFNVLRGDMSIVGPRPEVPSITDTYDDFKKQVLNYKPGMTGMSQVNGRAALDIDPKIKMEIEYQQRATFWSDMLIIIKTPVVLVTNKGNVM